jgi:uncharacterized membrane protein YphA (DoxX/SURF4 family)
MAKALSWVLQIALCGMFLMAGTLKLAGSPEMIDTFAAIGLGQWFRYFTGAVEAAGAFLILVPATAPYAALALGITMVGAIVTHLVVIGGSALAPIVLLTASLAVVWLRREQISSPARVARA